MNGPLEIPEHIRKAAAAVEIFFKVNGIEEWALMGIQSRNNEQTPPVKMVLQSWERGLPPVAYQEVTTQVLQVTDDAGKVLLTNEQHEELRRDKARLDAVQAHFWEVAGNRFGQWIVLFPNPDGSELIAKANSIREAIDAAMSADAKGAT